MATGLWMALSFCGVAPALAQARSESPTSPITSISVEKDCSGCPTGSVLTLRRDGTATYTVTGKARLGTTGAESTGTVSAETFTEIARFIESQGFFNLKDEYDDPQLKDGAWTTISVERGGDEKRVFRRDDAGPASLKAIEKAIGDLKPQIQFVPPLR